MNVHQKWENYVLNLVLLHTNWFEKLISIWKFGGSLYVSGNLICTTVISTEKRSCIVLVCSDRYSKLSKTNIGIHIHLVIIRAQKAMYCQKWILGCLNSYYVLANHGSSSLLWYVSNNTIPTVRFDTVPIVDLKILGQYD